MLVNPNNPTAEGDARAIGAAAEEMGVRLDVVEALSGPEIEEAFAALSMRSPEALLIGHDPFFNSERHRIDALRLLRQSPAIVEVSLLDGDGVMVLVNAPVPCADEPTQRAVRMALDMQAEVQTLATGWRRRGHRMGFGIGIAKGEATVGRVGYEGRHDYTAIGKVVNLASRLCASAADGQILLDEEAAAAVAGETRLLPLGQRTLKGFVKPVQAFAVTAIDEPSRPLATFE